MICLLLPLVCLISTLTTNVHLSTYELMPTVIYPFDSLPPFLLWPWTYHFQYDIEQHVTDKIFSPILYFVLTLTYKKNQLASLKGIYPWAFLCFLCMLCFQLFDHQLGNKLPWDLYILNFLFLLLFFLFPIFCAYLLQSGLLLYNFSFSFSLLCSPITVLSSHPCHIFSYPHLSPLYLVIFLMTQPFLPHLCCTT